MVIFGDKKNSCYLGISKIANQKSYVDFDTRVKILALFYSHTSADV